MAECRECGEFVGQVGDRCSICGHEIFGEESHLITESKMPDEIYAYKTSGSNSRHWRTEKPDCCTEHYGVLTKYIRADLQPQPEMTEADKVTYSEDELVEQYARAFWEAPPNEYTNWEIANERDKKYYKDKARTVIRALAAKNIITVRG